MKNSSKYLHFREDDIFKTIYNIISETNRTNTAIIVPHVCNNVAVFSGGFAKDIGEEYPIVKENFLALGPKEAKLGRVQYIDIYNNNQTKNKIVVANMIAQNNLISKTNTRPLNYNALVHCMNDVNRYALKLLDGQIENVSIHCPKFGSGLAGGNWIFIQELIRDIWSNYDINIYSKVVHNTSTQRR